MGDEAMERIAKARVILFGVGGVGSLVRGESGAHRHPAADHRG